MHVGAELQLGRLGRVGREGQLGEAVRDGLELQQRREVDVDVRLAHLGLHDDLDGLRVEHADGDVLGDDLLVLPAQGGLQVLGLEPVVIVVVVAERVIGGGLLASDSGRRVGAVGRGGRDGHGEHGEALLLGQAEGGGDAVESGLESPLERLER